MELSHPWTAVLEPGRTTWGGSQRLDPDPILRKCGCGVIAALDTLIYLHRHRPGFAQPLFRALSAKGGVSGTAYHQWTDTLRRRYFPLFPPFGVNGWTLAAGLNRYCRDNRLPLRARWGTGRLWETMAAQLAADLPVILCIGTCLPGRKLTLYVQKDGLWKPGTTVSAHFVTVTAMDDAWLTVSSWGRQYGIRRAEFDQYVRSASGPLLSNILVLRPEK